MFLNVNFKENNNNNNNVKPNHQMCIYFCRNFATVLRWSRQAASFSKHFVWRTLSLSMNLGWISWAKPLKSFQISPTSMMSFLYFSESSFCSLFPEDEFIILIWSLTFFVEFQVRKSHNWIDLKNYKHIFILKGCIANNIYNRYGWVKGKVFGFAGIYVWRFTLNIFKTSVISWI